MLRFPSLYIVWGNSNAKILEIRTWNGNSWEEELLSEEWQQVMGSYHGEKDFGSGKG